MPAVLASIVACLIVALVVLGWGWQYGHTRHRWEVAALPFMCPYCHYRVEPGAYIAEGSRGWGHWTCVD